MLFLFYSESPKERSFILLLDVEMDLQNKYQILAGEFAKVRGQVTVLKKAVIDEQTKSQQLQVKF